MSHLHLKLFIVCILISLSVAKKGAKDKPDWAKKDIRDYSDADLERLYDQWEEDEEPLDEDELPEHLRKPPPIDLSSFDGTDPESLLKASKKQRTVMAFVKVTESPTRDELEEITKIWQGSLMNNHINVDRFIIDEERAIFMFKDGSQAWEAKDYLVQQDRLEEVVIENQPFYGKYSVNKPKDAKASAQQAKSSRSKKSSSNDEL